jgi:hypothetical protein
MRQAGFYDESVEVLSSLRRKFSVSKNVVGRFYFPVFHTLYFLRQYRMLIRITTPKVTKSNGIATSN